MTDAPAGCPLRAYLWSVVFLAALAFPRWAMADLDLPAQIVVQGFVKVEDGRAHLLVRVPLILLSGFPLQRRGPGYLDLAGIEPKLRQVAAATSHQIELSADSVTLAPTVREVQLSLFSDRSFAGYSTALSHLQGPPLPANTDLFWNQGFFDEHLEYTLPSGRPNIWIRVNVAPELGQRIRVRFEYLPLGEPARSYEVAGNSGLMPLDPTWYEAAWIFVKSGFVDAFAIDRFVFLLCLVAPFRKLRGVLILVAVLIGLQALTLTAGAEGALADVEVGWLPVLSDTVLASAMVLLAIANLASPTLRRRCFLAAVVGTLGGFALGGPLTDAWQFVGTHPVVAVASFNVGVALGVVVSLMIAFFALRLLFARVFGDLLGLIVVSAILGHAGWHGMMDKSGELVRQLGNLPAASLWPALAVVALWMVPALLVGLMVCFVPRRFDGVPVPTLLRALQGRSAEERSARA